MQTCFETSNDKLHIHIKNKTNLQMFSKNWLVTRKTKWKKETKTKTKNKKTTNKQTNKQTKRVNYDQWEIAWKL